MADGTTLNLGTGGDTIATEDMADNSGVGTAPSSGQRQISGLPATEYKMPRSKIAVGAYDADAGDAAPVNPLDVRTYYERRAAEDALVMAVDANNRAFCSRNHYGRDQMCDRRGGMGQRGLR